LAWELPKSRRVSEKRNSALPALVFQPSLHHLTRLRVQQRNLLRARVQITAYNQHVSAPPSESPGFLPKPVYSPPSRSRRPYAIRVTDQLCATLLCAMAGHSASRSALCIIDPRTSRAMSAPPASPFSRQQCGRMHAGPSRQPASADSAVMDHCALRIKESSTLTQRSTYELLAGDDTARVS